MEEKSKIIKEICQKQNFEKMLLSIKNINKSNSTRKTLEKLEEIKNIDSTLKREIYQDIFDYIDHMNKCYKKEIKNIFIKGIQATIAQLCENPILDSISNMRNEIQMKEGIEMAELEHLIENIKTEGIERDLDELGRIFIPSDYRNGKVIEGETPVKIHNIGKYVVIEILEGKAEKHQKKFDELGRVVVPIEIRNELRWKTKDKIKIWDSGKYFILQKVRRECIFCGETNNLIKYRNELLCENCKQELKAM